MKKVDVNKKGSRCVLFISNMITAGRVAMSETIGRGAADAAIYLRLSREEHPDAGGDSESISTQRMLLLQYAQQHGFIVTAEFVDDGISGTRRDRAGLRALTAAIGEGWIRTVLVKDLSRLSRDYIHTGELLERWFPAHGVRLISVNDGIDTAAQSVSNDFSAIRAVMDDWYARDISRKVRSAIYARQQAGYCTLAHLPYGYVRRDNTVCADERTAEYVRMLFEGYLSLENCRKTAELMDTAGAPLPGRGAKWNDTSVRHILQNTAYIGSLRLRTTRKTGYKCNRREHLPAGSAVIYPVPPLIPDTLFSAAQEILMRRQHCRTDDAKYAGKLVCGLCGCRMIRSEDRYVCGGRKRGSSCRNPSLRGDMLDAQLMNELRDICGDIPAEQLARMIRQITVYPDSLRVQMHCKLPDFV